MIYARMKALLRHHDFKLFTRPYELNIVGLRNRERRANAFDDEIHVFYHLPNGQVKYHRFVATTDPGLPYLENPLNGQNTAILKQGQWPGYELGLHRGKTPALVQRQPVTVLLDGDRNGLLNFASTHEATGSFGINLHPAFGREPRRYVGTNSAGCQVLRDDADMATLLRLANVHRDRYGNRFTYTLLDFRELRNETIKHVAIGGAVAASALLAYLRPEVLAGVADWFEDLFKSSSADD